MTSSAKPESHPPSSAPQVFDAWLQACANDPWAPLSPDAAEPYRFIWGAWVKFLSTHAAEWNDANPELVLAFINHATRSHKKADMPSDITRRRYWRVLDRLYGHAELHGWASSNPAAGLTKQDIPPSEDPKGAILTPTLWQSLIRHIPKPDSLITARDHAALTLLTELGITSEELRALEIKDVQFDTNVPCLFCPPLDKDTWKRSFQEPSQHPCSLQIIGTRAMQTRVLALSPSSSRALEAWLKFRSSYAAMDQQPALFCSRKAPQISAHTVLHMATKTIQLASSELGITPARLGPQVIRNTVIIHWLQTGLTTAEVLQLSGLKTLHALNHLKSFI